MKFAEDPKFSFIVPAYDVPEHWFKNCLRSIAEQDYENLEVIIVVNGGDEKAYEIANEWAKDRKNWKAIFTEEKGACLARNLGFQASTGDIVSFFNSDYIANPGMVRTWVDKLQENPDCGFVYGAYEYATAERDAYWSKPFDEYQLSVANYIDCGFPLWRKYVVDWDTNVKSLQDWDFWIRVVKSGVKGFYLGRYISFVAALPRPKGLSNDSHDNWIERVKFVKEKNEIPLNDICVTSIGAPNHGIEIAKMLGADFRDDTIYKPNEYKALYLIGWYMRPDQTGNEHPRIMRWFDKPGVKRIVHFVGADIYWLKKFPWGDLKTLTGALQMVSDHILCENELAQKELAELGIKAEIVPIPVYSDFSVQPLPKEFSVALYLTDRSDFDKYLLKHTLSIVKAMPDVKFYGYGDASLDGFPKLRNFEHKGTLKRLEWEKFVYDCSAYLRIVRHDTRPLATDEFLMAGRNVITNIPGNFVDYVPTSGDLKLNEWDSFSPGFSVRSWPDTKKKLIKKIREVRERQSADGNVFEAERLAAHTSLKLELDRNVYRKKIYQLAGIAQEEPAHA